MEKYNVVLRKVMVKLGFMPRSGISGLDLTPNLLTLFYPFEPFTLTTDRSRFATENLTEVENFEPRGENKS